MTKKILFLFMLLSAATISQAQSTQADTFYLSVYNTGARIEITPADFGGKVTQDLMGTMVRAFDTVMVLKANGAIDSTGNKRLRHEAERRADRISKDIKDKIVVMELNKDIDVTLTCINVQRGGAKALILIHTSNKKEDIKLKKLGAFKDSLRIPCFTVRNTLGDSLWGILPSVAGIKAPTVPPVQSLQAQNSTLLNSAQAINKEKANPTGLNDATTTNNTQSGGFTNSYSSEKIGWDLSPNPASQEAILHYNFTQTAPLSIEVFNEAGQLVTNYNLPDNLTGTLNMDVSSWVTGIYSVRLVSGDLKEVKRLVVVH